MTSSNETHKVFLSRWDCSVIDAETKELIITGVGTAWSRVCSYMNIEPVVIRQRCGSDNNPWSNARGLLEYAIEKKLPLTTLYNGLATAQYNYYAHMLVDMMEKKQHLIHPSVDKIAILMQLDAISDWIKTTKVAAKITNQMQINMLFTSEEICAIICEAIQPGSKCSKEGLHFAIRGSDINFGNLITVVKENPKFTDPKYFEALVIFFGLIMSS